MKLFGSQFEPSKIRVKWNEIRNGKWNKLKNIKIEVRFKSVMTNLAYEMNRFGKEKKDLIL